jgi:hypothetical protein
VNDTTIRFERTPTINVSELTRQGVALQPNGQIVSGSVLNTLNRSVLDVEINNLKTFTGDIQRIRLYKKNIATPDEDFVLVSDKILERDSLLKTVEGYEYGRLASERDIQFWNTGSSFTGSATVN